MTLPAFIPRSPARLAVLMLGTGFFVASIPLAVLNLGVSAFASERVARVFLIAEVCVAFGFLAYVLFVSHQSHGI